MLSPDVAVPELHFAYSWDENRLDDIVVMLERVVFRDPSDNLSYSQRVLVK